MGDTSLKEVSGPLASAQRYVLPGQQLGGRRIAETMRDAAGEPTWRPVGKPC